MNWLAGLLAGMLLGWIFLPTPMAVCGIYQSSAMPAWVQAVGSVLAIGVAAVIPWWQEKIRKKEEGKQLSIAVLRLRSNLEVLGRAATDNAALLRGFNWEDCLPKDVHELMHNVYLWEIRPVDAYIDRMHGLETKIQDPILELLQEHDQYGIDRDSVQEAGEHMKAAVLESCRTTLITRLERIGQLAFKAASAIRVVSEEKQSRAIRARNAGGRP
jgi:hypothetical protein